MYLRSSDGTLAPFVFGVAQTNKGNITLGKEKETWKPKERRRTTMSGDFLRKLIIKLNTDKKRGI